MYFLAPFGSGVSKALIPGGFAGVMIGGENVCRPLFIYVWILTYSLPPASLHLTFFSLSEVC